MNPRVLYRAASYATDARAAADSVISALTPAAWYRNATGVTESGGFASQWDDYSGNARHLVQGVGTNQPAYSAGVLTFDGADNYMVASSWSQAQPTTVALVGKQISWTPPNTFFDGSSGLSSGRLLQFTATPQIFLAASSTAAGNSNLTVGSRGVIVAVFNNASSSIRVNNTTKTTGTAGTNNMGGFVLGASGGLGAFSNITAEEVIIFPSALSDANQDAVITALNNALTVF